MGLHFFRVVSGFLFIFIFADTEGHPASLPCCLDCLLLAGPARAGAPVKSNSVFGFCIFEYRTYIFGLFSAAAYDACSAPEVAVVELELSSPYISLLAGLFLPLSRASC